MATGSTNRPENTNLLQPTKFIQQKYVGLGTDKYLTLAEIIKHHLLPQHQLVQVISGTILQLT